MPDELVRAIATTLVSGARHIIDAQRKSRRVVQRGTQRRSSPPAIEAVQAIRYAIIGRTNIPRACYANRRATIGRGKAAPVPADLQYELSQAPAPRTPRVPSYRSMRFTRSASFRWTFVGAAPTS